MVVTSPKKKINRGWIHTSFLDTQIRYLRIYALRFAVFVLVKTALKSLLSTFSHIQNAPVNLRGRH